MSAAAYFSGAALAAAVLGPLTLGILTRLGAVRHHREVMGELSEIRTLLIDSGGGGD